MGRYQEIAWAVGELEQIQADFSLGVGVTDRRWLEWESMLRQFRVNECSWSSIEGVVKLVEGGILECAQEFTLDFIVVGLELLGEISRCLAKEGNALSQIEEMRLG